MEMHPLHHHHHHVTIMELGHFFTPFRYHTSRSRFRGVTWSLVPFGVDFLFPKHAMIKLAKLKRIYPALGS